MNYLQETSLPSSYGRLTPAAIPLASFSTILLLLYLLSCVRSVKLTATGNHSTLSLHEKKDITISIKNTSTQPRELTSISLIPRGYDYSRGLSVCACVCLSVFLHSEIMLYSREFSLVAPFLITPYILHPEQAKEVTVQFQPKPHFARHGVFETEVALKYRDPPQGSSCACF